MLSLLSCTHSPQPGPGNSTNTGNTGNGAPADPDNPSFKNDILPIFLTNCAGCHNTSIANEGFIFTSYETITARKFTPGDPDNTKLYEAITDDDEEDRMPQTPNPRLPDDKILLIRNWIRNGAPNN